MKSFKEFVKNLRESSSDGEVDLGSDTGYGMMAFSGFSNPNDSGNNQDYYSASSGHYDAGSDEEGGDNKDLNDKRYLKSFKEKFKDRFKDRYRDIKNTTLFGIDNSLTLFPNYSVDDFIDYIDGKTPNFVSEGRDVDDESDLHYSEHEEGDEDNNAPEYSSDEIRKVYNDTIPVNNNLRDPKEVITAGKAGSLSYSTKSLIPLELDKQIKSAKGMDIKNKHFGTLHEIKVAADLAGGLDKIVHFKKPENSPEAQHERLSNTFRLRDHYSSEGNEINGMATNAASDIRNEISKRYPGYEIHRVGWTGDGNEVEKFTGQRDPQNDSDIVLHLKHPEYGEKYLGISLKSSRSTKGINFRNPGRTRLENILGMKPGTISSALSNHSDMIEHLYGDLRNDRGNITHSAVVHQYRTDIDDASSYHDVRDIEDPDLAWRYQRSRKAEASALLCQDRITKSISDRMRTMSSDEIKNSLNELINPKVKTDKLFNFSSTKKGVRTIDPSLFSKILDDHSDLQVEKIEHPDKIQRFTVISGINPQGQRKVVAAIQTRLSSEISHKEPWFSVSSPAIDNHLKNEMYLKQLKSGNISIDGIKSIMRDPVSDHRVIEYGLNYPNWEIRGMASRHKSARPEMLDKFIFNHTPTDNNKGFKADALEQAVRNPNMTHELIKKVFAHPDMTGWTLKHAAQNPNIDEEGVLMGMLHKNKEVRDGLQNNPIAAWFALKDKNSRVFQGLNDSSSPYFGKLKFRKNSKAASTADDFAYRRGFIE